MYDHRPNFLETAVVPAELNTICSIWTSGLRQNTKPAFSSPPLRDPCRQRHPTCRFSAQCVGSADHYGRHSVRAVLMQYLTIATSCRIVVVMPSSTTVDPHILPRRRPRSSTNLFLNQYILKGVSSLNRRTSYLSLHNMLYSCRVPSSSAKGHNASAFHPQWPPSRLA